MIQDHSDRLISCYLSQKKHYWTYYTPSKFLYHCLNILKVTGDGIRVPSPRSQKIKKPGLNTVNLIGLRCGRLVVVLSHKDSCCLSYNLISFRLVLLCREIIVPRGEWIHVAMSWKRGVSGKLKLYANGEKKFENVVDGNANLDFKNSGRSVYNIGLRVDTGYTIKAYLCDLVIFNRELPEHELKEEWVQSHALYKILK